MSPEYHAWTHRSKAQGGTDPIETSAPSFIRAIYQDSTGVTSISTTNKNLDWTWWQNQDPTVFDPRKTDNSADPVNGTDLMRYIRLQQKGLYSFRVVVKPLSLTNMSGFKISLNDFPEDTPYGYGEDIFHGPSLGSYNTTGWITFAWDRIYPLIDPFDSAFSSALVEWPLNLGGGVNFVNSFFTMAAVMTSGTATVKQANLEITYRSLDFPTDTSWPPPD